MSDSMDIRDVSRKTGLTSRALRFYETKGLITPLRMASGRRVFGRQELARLHQIVILKSAGLSLAQMKQLFDGKPFDLSAMLSAQIKMLAEEAAQNQSTQAVILLALARIKRGDPLDTETLCSLIESGGKMMEQEPKEWKQVTDRYFTLAEKAEWADKLTSLPKDFDFAAYGAQWKILGDEIQSALPLSADSEAAQSFVDRWYNLLKPLAEIYTPEMWNGAVRLYDKMDDWAGDGAGYPDPGFNKQVWDFMKLATSARLAASGQIEPLGPEYWNYKAKAEEGN